METYKYPITVSEKARLFYFILFTCVMTLPNALMSALQAETYEAHVASQPTGAEHDVQEIIGTVECKISDTSSSPKDPDTPSSPKKRRARGRPRKLVD